jgi:hypothetical protein
MRTIKIALAVLLLLCLAEWPYGFYQFVRFVAAAGFAWLALDASKEKNQHLLFIYIALALLFQPFFKIALGRTLWNIVDVSVAAWLLYSEFIGKKNQLNRS